MFHLGFFMLNGFGVQPWRNTFSGPITQSWMKADYYRDLAKTLERGGFDYVLMEDTAMIEDTYGGSMEATLAHSYHAPKNDPIPLAPLMIQGSQHIGVLSTISTTQHHPYVAARLMATLDHLTDGRFGGNIVTSVTHRLAHNMGLDKLPPHDLRYEVAAEWMDCAGALWNSWEDGAVVADENSGIYIDHTKVHTIDFKGDYFASRGPLSTMPGPQGRPTIAQAGASPAGRDFAAKYADIMLAEAKTPEAMKKTREDIHERLRKFGRKPSDLKIMFIATPVLGDTDEHARDRAAARDARQNSDDHIRDILWNLSYMSGGEVDYAKLDIDTKLPELFTDNGEQTGTAFILKGNEDRTLREIATSTTSKGTDLGMIGSPDTVAAKMGEVMDEAGGDGFLILPLEMDRRSFAEYADGLSPALRRRGLIRDGYDHQCLRDNMLDF